MYSEGKGFLLGFFFVNFPNKSEEKFKVVTFVYFFFFITNLFGDNWAHVYEMLTNTSVF